VTIRRAGNSSHAFESDIQLGKRNEEGPGRAESMTDTGGLGRVYRRALKQTGNSPEIAGNSPEIASNGGP